MDAIPRFAADRMLLRLARRLRLLGADTIFDTGIDGAAMLKRARIEGRIMLTRDKRLRTAPDVLFLDSDNFVEQLRSVLAHHPFDVFEKAFSRCSRCNTPLIMVDREVIRARIPPFIYASHEKFAECPHCAHLYWPGTHPDRILQDLRRLQEASEASNRG
ncbi:MAG TPA: Mut7-C RNAse domain-containing protein [Candidatus Binataceae bacterium]|nr:Mut7-C RNAse domain-containing protein [Candidatus Binataceae bacterium]